MRNSLAARASASRETGSPASAHAFLHAMTRSHASPTAALPPMAQHLHIARLHARHKTFRATSPRPRDANACPSHPICSVATGMPKRRRPMAPRAALPLFSLPLFCCRAHWLGFLLLLFVNGSVPQRARCSLHGTDRIAAASAASPRPWSSPRPCPAAAVTAEAAPAPPFALRMLRTSPCHFLPPATSACIPPPQFPTCNSDMHATFPRHVPFPPWDPPDPQPNHVPCGHVPLPRASVHTSLTLTHPARA